MIHNISIATDDDIIQFGDDVNYIFLSISCKLIWKLSWPLSVCVKISEYYSNLTYLLGIGPLGCEYSTLLYSLPSIRVCSLSGLRQFSPYGTLTDIQVSAMR